MLATRSIEAVQRLRDAGVAFTITSGRPPLGRKMLMDQFPSQGRPRPLTEEFFVHPDLSVMTQNMAKEDAIKVIEAIMRHGLDCWVTLSATGWYETPRVLTWRAKPGPSSFRRRLFANFDSQMERVAKIVGVSDDHAAVARCEADVQTDCGNRVSAARSQPYYLDVTHPDANKGQVVTVLAQSLPIPPAEIAPLGDMPNDALMFRKSGLSIAMGNASPEVQAQAAFVTPPTNRKDLPTR